MLVTTSHDPSIDAVKLQLGIEVDLPVGDSETEST